MRRIAIGLLVLVLLMVFGACAETEAVRIAEVCTEIGESHVRYPQLEGMSDEDVQQRINDDIVLSSGVTEHLMTMVTIGQNPWKITVDYEAGIVDGRCFSAVLSAKGKMAGERDGQRYTALCYDLETGERVTLGDLFTDADEAVSRMEEMAIASLEEELTGYMEYSELTPLPRDAFTLDEKGITFWYPSDRFRLYSGNGGAVQFWYEELDGLWKESFTQALSEEERREAIAKAVEEGRLPKVDAVLNQPVDEVTEAFGLLREPDAFPGGRMFVLEDPGFRSVLVLSDGLAGDDPASVVEGIQLRRGGLCGLRVGETGRDEWQSLLGDPHDTMTVTENMAYDYNLPAGACDVYRYGDHALRLYADEAGVLSAIQLTK